MDRSRDLVSTVTDLAASNTKNNKTLKLINCDELEIGRMVKYKNKFYYVSEINKDTSNKITKIKIKNNYKDNDKTEIEIKENDIAEIAEIKTYNYGDILDKIDILSNIILFNKYLILDNKDKQTKYIEIIENIENIMININELEGNANAGQSRQSGQSPQSGGTEADEETTSPPTAAEETASPLQTADEETTSPPTAAVKQSSGERKGVKCIDNPYILGRLVKYNDVFYYVSGIEENGTIKIKNENEEKLEEVIQMNIKQIKPYNYNELTNSLLSLFKIILEKQYLYNNDDKINNMDKMEIIKTINGYLDLIPMKKSV